ncbi:MAG: hypothetical protein LBV46_01050 [Bacteroidales bacterium]|jgi:hypothetical protein|nr:hypothetical protein [Bacteroidales bacterium]
MRRLLFFIGMLTICQSLFSQKNSDFKSWQNSLQHLRDEVMQAPNEVERMSLNEEFMSFLEEVLLAKNSYNYTWDSVRNFSVVASPDGEFKLFTWYILKDDYSYENFGFIQKRNSNRMKDVLFPLYDKRSGIDYPQSYIGDINRWYGAVYYKIIPVVVNKTKTYYTLLGWNGNNLFTNQKIIEVLSFKNNTEQTPIFGANVFLKYSTSRVSRIIIEYSKEAMLSLKYEKQSYLIKTDKRDKKTNKPIFKEIFSDMIIFDQLYPADDAMPAVPSALLPESSMNQGFVINDNQKWLYISSVIGRNPTKTLPVPHPQPKIFHNPNSHTP